MKRGIAFGRQESDNALLALVHEVANRQNKRASRGQYRFRILILQY